MRQTNKSRTKNEKRLGSRIENLKHMQNINFWQCILKQLGNASKQNNLKENYLTSQQKFGDAQFAVIVIIDNYF